MDSKETLDLFHDATNAQTFPDGQLIFNEGDPGHVAYAVLSGTVDVQIRGQTIYTVGPGSIVGEMALIDRSPRSATAIARGDARLVPFDDKRFVFLVERSPFFALTVMRILAERLRAGNVRV